VVFDRIGSDQARDGEWLQGSRSATRRRSEEHPSEVALSLLVVRPVVIEIVLLDKAIVCLEGDSVIVFENRVKAVGGGKRLEVLKVELSRAE
jgi:hypothetical protein